MSLHEATCDDLNLPEIIFMTNVSKIVGGLHASDRSHADDGGQGIVGECNLAFKTCPLRIRAFNRRLHIQMLIL